MQQREIELIIIEINKPLLSIAFSIHMKIKTKTLKIRTIKRFWNSNARCSQYCYCSCVM